MPLAVPKVHVPVLAESLYVSQCTRCRHPFPVEVSLAAEKRARKRRNVPTNCIHDVGRRENPTGKVGKNMSSHCLIICKHVTTAEMHCLPWYLENSVFKK